MSVDTMLGSLYTFAGFLGTHREFLDSLSYDAQKEANPELEYEDISYVTLWYDGNNRLYITCNGPDTASLMARVCKELGGKWDKGIVTRTTFHMTRRLGQENGYNRVRVEADRERVCTRKVVGTETVEITDYDNAPTKTVEREIVEWDCPPSLLSLTKQEAVTGE